MHRVTATAPTRIDLAGATLDIWPLHCLFENVSTINFGIDLNAEVKITTNDKKQFEISSLDQNFSVSGNFHETINSNTYPLASMLLANFWQEELGGLTIETRAKSPAGAGLGGSSCLAIALAGALTRLRNKLQPSFDLTEREIISGVSNTEARLIRTPTGIQDYWGAMRGALNILDFNPLGVNVTTIADQYVDYMNDHMVVVYCGKSRDSAMNNWEIFKGVFENNQQLQQVFQEITDCAKICRQFALNGEWKNLLEHSHMEWELRKKLWPGIETEETRKIDRATQDAGAYFSRVCGAGGGGVMAVFCPSSSRQSVSEAAASVGGTILDAKVSPKGLQVHFE